MSNIQAIRLSSGEELVAEVAELNNVEIKLMKPVAIGFREIPPDGREAGKPKIGLAFSPWGEHLDKTQAITFKLSDVMFHHPVNSDLETAYRSIVSKLVLPDSVTNKLFRP